MDTFLIGIAVTVIGGLILAGIIFLLKHRWQKRKKKNEIVAPLVDSLRKVLPTIKNEVSKDHFYLNDIRALSNFIESNKLTTAYAALPDTIQNLIRELEATLTGFAKTSNELRKALYKLYEQIPDKQGGGGPDEIPATRLVFMEEDSIPNKTVPVNFPRADSKGSFSQTKVSAEQLRSIRDAVKGEFPTNEYAKLKEKALEILEELDRVLLKLQKS
jgi:hypothetical protein